MDFSLPDSSAYGDSPGKNTGVSCQGPSTLPYPGMKARSLASQADSLQSEPPGKPQNTGVDSLTLLQENFPTQELNLGLLNCRRILYQLSYQGSPPSTYTCTYTKLKFPIFIEPRWDFCCMPGYAKKKRKEKKITKHLASALFLQENKPHLPPAILIPVGEHNLIRLRQL